MPKVTITRREADRDLLPRVCALTGEPTDDVKLRKFMWYPQWINLTILIALPIALILSLVMRKEMTVNLPLIRQKHGHWLWRQLAAGLMLLGAIVCAPAGGILASKPSTETLGGVLVALGVVLFFATIVFVIVINYTTIRPTEITDREMTLTGVHQNFVDALEEDRERDRDEDDDRDRGRRKKKKRVRVDDDDDYRD